MKKHYFSKRRRSRKRSRRSSRKSLKRRKRVGNKVHLANGKVLKVQKDKKGREFIRSGKSKTKTYVGKSGRRVKSKRFGRQPGLVNMMGNYAPSKMNTFQQYTGMSAPQMSKHMGGVLKSDRANFYTNVN